MACIPISFTLLDGKLRRAGQITKIVIVGKRRESQSTFGVPVDLFPFDGNVGGRHFESHHAVVAVHVNHNFKVRRTDAHGFVFPVSCLL